LKILVSYITIIPQGNCANITPERVYVSTILTTTYVEQYGVITNQRVFIIYINL